MNSDRSIINHGARYQGTSMYIPAAGGNERIGGMNVFPAVKNKVPSRLFNAYCLIHVGPREEADLSGRQQT